MKVRIYIDKVDAFKAGSDKHGYQIVLVPAADLTSEQRDYLAAQNELRGTQDPDADFYLDSGKDAYGHTYPFTETTKDQVIACIDRNIPSHTAKVQKEKAEYEQAVARVLAADLGDLINSNYKLVYWLPDPGPSVRLETIEKDPRLAAKLAQVDAECQRLRAESDARDKAETEARRLATEAREKEEAASKATQTAKLKEWAIEHGSELLKARIEGGYEWGPLAVKEFGRYVLATAGIELAKADVPESSYTECDVQERTTPTLDEIKCLDDVRKRLKDQPVTTELVWCVYKDDREPSYDEDGEMTDTVKSQCEVRVKVTAPNGSVVTSYYLPTPVTATA